MVNFRSILILSAFFIIASTPSEVPTVRNPNILFIAIDDLNDWLGCMQGHPDARTPNIDRLAAQGTLFLNAHCQAPICGPSRASLMTGLRPSTTGIYGQIKDEQIMAAIGGKVKFEFLPSYLGRHGYKTMGVGKLFHGFAPPGVFEQEGGREAGFGPKPDKRFKYNPAWFGKSGSTQTDWGVYPLSDNEMPDFRSTQWAIDRLAEKHDRPFFLAIGFLRPHVPWYVPQKWFDLFPSSEITLPPYLKGDEDDLPALSSKLHEVPMMPTTEWAKETGEWLNMVQAYLACIAFVDHYVGTVIDALQKSDYASNTIVVLLSDHGYHLGEKNRFAKHSLWQESTHVPLIIAGAGLPVNQRCTEPIELLDLYPTLLDLCSLAPNVANEGVSLVPLLLDPEAVMTKPALTTYGRNNHAFRSGQYRYVVFEDGSEELYDHQEDPNEWKNLADNQEFDQSKMQLKKYYPAKNVKWVEQSEQNANQYLIDQRLKDLESRP